MTKMMKKRKRKKLKMERNNQRNQSLSKRQLKLENKIY